MKKILINGLQLGDTNTGVQYYTQNLFRELEHLDRYNFEYELLLPSNCKQKKTNRLERIFFENFHIRAYLNNNFDLYHSPNYVLPYFFNFPSVLTVHDLITIDYPQFCQTESVLYFKLFLGRSVKKATKIIAVSETVKNDILKHFHVSEEKINVVYHGISHKFRKIENTTRLKEVRQKYGLPERFILFVGNIEPKKNLERLIQAFDLLLKTTELQHKLVIVGKRGWKYDPVFNIISKLKLSQDIIFTGYVPEEDLVSIYNLSDLFVFPSLYEGFGFPPLEAMACEIPVIVSNKGSLPEVTGGRCPQVDPYNMNELKEMMYKILTDKNLRDEYVRQGKQWANQFSWKKAAKETLETYHQALITNL